MRLSRINSFLLVLIVLVNLYVVALPLLPAALFAVAAHSGQRRTLTQKVQAPPQPATSPTRQTAPNNLIVPSMLLDQPILEGRDTYAVLSRGILHLAASSTPDKGGNTVLIGHRFTYSTPKGVFYYLDKARPGDELAVTWNGRKYIYKVSQTKVVPPTDVSIENATADARLTLFTCTPLLWPKGRLVVVAMLEAAP